MIRTWKKLGLIGHGLVLLYIGPELIKSVNQVGMPFEKYEDFLELTVTQLITEARLTSLGQIMGGVWKTNTLLVAKLARYSLYRTRVTQVQV